MTILFMREHAVPAIYNDNLSKTEKLSFSAMIVLLYLSSYVFEGVVRYALSKAHLASMLYLRDGLPVVAVAAMLVGWLADRYRPSLLLITIGIISFHFFLGFFYIGRTFQQLLGVKTLMSLVLGVAVGTVGMFSPRQTKLFATWLVLISVAGIVVNYAIPFPWEGEEFDTVFGVTSQSRLWTAGGVRRLSGLARASYDAASILLCGAAMVAATYEGIWKRSALILLAAVGITLTTSKGAMIAVLALMGMLIVSNGGKRLSIVRLSVLVSVSVMVAAPLLSFVLDIRMRNLPSGLAWSLSSYVDRMENTWPAALKLLLDHGNLLLGRGPGGIGTPQLYGDARLYNPGDNLFVYWTVIFGMLGWLYGAVVLIRLLFWDAISLMQRTMVYGFFLVSFMYGVTTNLVEQPVVGFGLGCAIAVIFRPRVVNKRG